MADNYLERKMEDYRRGTASVRRLTHTGDTPGTLRLKLRPRPVLIYDAAGACGETLVSMLSGAGFRVAFTSGDASWGKELAQRTGSLFIPAGVDAEDTFRRRCGGIEATVVHGDRVITHSSPVACALRVIADIIDDDER
ncbi:MAG: hypothetical protein K2L80_02690 [Muribaculaceae bacterium]|nr:hypothetical protein [Muribaculaceae bacterium]MDE6331489.1 hypothetical protein [Muribaculaceae bacterium]